MLCPKCGRGKFKATDFYCGVCQIELKKLGMQSFPRNAERPTVERTQKAWRGYGR